MVVAVYHGVKDSREVDDDEEMDREASRALRKKRGEKKSKSRCAYRGRVTRAPSACDARSRRTPNASRRTAHLVARFARANAELATRTRRPFHNCPMSRADFRRRHVPPACDAGIPPSRARTRAWTPRRHTFAAQNARADLFHPFRAFSRRAGRFGCAPPRRRWCCPAPTLGGRKSSASCVSWCGSTACGGARARGCPRWDRPRFDERDARDHRHAVPWDPVRGRSGPVRHAG